MGNGNIENSMSLSSSKLWTPHEVKLQSTVHRRAGELHALTAAGTSGRTVAPRREDRFQRLEREIHTLARQRETLLMTVEDLASRTAFSSGRSSIDCTTTNNITHTTTTTTTTTTTAAAVN